MTALITNRDLYLFIAELAQEHAKSALPLAEYLARLRELGRAHGARGALSLDELAAMLRGAFSAQGPQPAAPQPHPEYLAWDARLEEQLRDLREMAEDGTLADEERSFGVDGPSGARWYNFDPVGYLECAVAGTFGGWQEGDPTDREYVPGLVTTMNADGQWITADPRDLDDPIVPIAEVSWATFAEFLIAGQSYE
jgi:hypothetical protein